MQRREYPFDRISPPQTREKLPTSIDWGSIQHAHFLWNACFLMRGGIKSEVAIRALGRMYDDCPHLFLSQNIASLNDGDVEGTIREELQKHNLGFQSTLISKHWPWNLRKLHRFWGSDPRNLFRRSNGYEELCSIIIAPHRKDPNNASGFYGFRHKMVSMLTYFCVHAGMVDVFTHPVPVDFHVLRILTAHGILVSEDIRPDNSVSVEPLQEAARTVTVWYVKEYQADPIQLCDALWLFSSNMCSLHTGNKSEIGDRNGSKTEIHPFVHVWSHNHEQTFLDTCRYCQIRRTCNLNVPSAPYYIHRQLAFRDKKTKEPPQLFLDL